MHFYYIAYILAFSTLTKDSSVYCSSKDKSVTIQFKAEIEDNKEPLIEIVDKMNSVLEKLKGDLSRQAKIQLKLPLNEQYKNSTISKKKHKKKKILESKNKKKKHRGSKKKKGKTKKQENIFRTTAIQDRTMSKKGTTKKKAPTIPPERNGPYTTLILQIMDHFVTDVYEEAYAYAHVINKKITYFYIYNYTGIWRLGDKFVKLMKGAAKYATTVPDIYLQKRIAYVRSFMRRRRQTFTPGFNEILDYADSIMTQRDRLRFPFLLKDLKNPSFKRERFLSRFIYQTITRPLQRMPNYEVELLAKKLTYEIEHSIFNHAFDKYTRNDDEDEDIVEFDKELIYNNSYDDKEEIENNSHTVTAGKPQAVTSSYNHNMYNGFKMILKNVANMF